jgi:hypothetical protein
MIIGYSCWGFLGAGILDTPDGARSYRRPVVDGLRRLGHDIVFLQRDRDRLEAGDVITDFRWDAGLPPLDVLTSQTRLCPPRPGGEGPDRHQRARRSC